MSDVIIAGIFTVVGAIIASSSSLLASHSANKNEAKRFERQVQEQKNSEKRERCTNSYTQFMKAGSILKSSPEYKDNLIQYHKLISEYGGELSLYLNEQMLHKFSVLMMEVEHYLCDATLTVDDEALLGIRNKAADLACDMRNEMKLS